MLRIVLFARAKPCLIASSKLTVDVELISDIFATFMAFSLAWYSSGSARVLMG